MGLSKRQRRPANATRNSKLSSANSASQPKKIVVLRILRHGTRAAAVQSLDSACDLLAGGPDTFLHHRSASAILGGGPNFRSARSFACAGFHLHVPALAEAGELQ